MIEFDAFGVVFDGFSLGPLSAVIGAEERVALIGANGAGKSTTLKGISGLLSKGYRGSVKVLGREVRESGPDLRTKVGLLPERLHGFGWMTVARHLDFLRSIYPTWDVARATELAHRLDLPLETKLANLSKGMQVKLSLVVVEAFRPPILLLDEPTSGIDPVMRREILALIRECTPAGGGRTVVFSSHILEDIETASDRVLLLRRGALIADLRIDELRTDDAGSISEQLVARLGAS